MEKKMEIKLGFGFVLQLQMSNQQKIKWHESYWPFVSQPTF